MVIEDETEFCGEELLHSMLKCKVRLGWAKWEAVGEGMGPLFVCLFACLRECGVKIFSWWWMGMEVYVVVCPRQCFSGNSLASDWCAVHVVSSQQRPH